LAQDRIQALAKTVMNSEDGGNKFLQNAGNTYKTKGIITNKNTIQILTTMKTSNLTVMNLLVP
jgi:hypothetical protein